ncbi:Hsp70 family protein [Buchnera aphidicola]|uniref:Hsp70 family protein n=1 Tax=Buchnera aphidicola TaxID=9 RepID=UPI001FCC1A6C
MKIINIFDNKRSFPSIIYLNKEKTVIGWKAKKFLSIDPKNTIKSIKRFIGIKYSEINKKKVNISCEISENIEKELVFHTDAGKITVSSIIKKFFSNIKKIIEKKLQKHIGGIVVTVPAYFNNIQKNIIRKSIERSQIKVLRLLNEPTAAAIAYGLEKKRKGFICVYDLGGGTFDVSILKISKGIFEVLSTNGDSKLGGDDFDYLLAVFLYSKIKNKIKINSKIFRKLIFIAEKVKINLSSQKLVTLEFLNQKITCSIKEFNDLIDSHIEKTLQIVSIALKDARLKISHIDDIILVGGSTYIPIIQSKVNLFFNKIPLVLINPTEVVVRGAGIQAYFLSNIKNNIKKSILLLDIIPLSIGIELIGGIMEKMIKKNTKIPTESIKVFTTFQDNQTGFCINVYQGEDKYVKNCKLLTKFKIKGLPYKKEEKIKLIVIFRIDVDNILSIIVKEKQLNIKRTIKIDSIYNNKNYIDLKNN